MATFHIFRPFIPPTVPELRSVREIVHSEIAKTRGLLTRWMHVKELWGPRVWYYIHRTTYEYKEAESYSLYQCEVLEEWVRQIFFLIPCSACRRRYRKHISSFSIAGICSSGERMFRFYHSLHNRVNRELKKNVYSMRDSIESMLAI